MATTKRDKEIATTILTQMGGHRFITMTGAKNFGVVEKGLMMQLLQGKTTNKANWLTIRLDEGTDTYIMKFEKITKPRWNSKKGTMTEGKRVTISEYQDVYFDQLEEIFTAETGLYTRLF